MTLTRESVQPSVSAATCATIVSEPWPISDAGVNNHAAIAVNLDVHGGVRHVGADNRVGRSAHVVAASNAEAPASGQFSLALVPARARHYLINAFWETVALHAQAVDRDAGGRRIWRISAGSRFSLAAISSSCDSNANRTLTVPCPRIAPHAGLLVSTREPSNWTLGISYSAPSSGPIKNRHHAVAAIRSTILHNPRLNRGQPAVALTAAVSSTMVRSHPRCAKNTSSRV